MQYRYSAFDEAGRESTGLLEAGDLEEAERWVMEHFFGYVAIRPVRRFNWKALNVSIGGDKVSPVDVAFVLQQVASMLRVGVPVSRALAMQAGSIRSKRLREIVGAIAERVSQGARVTDALALYPKVFPAVVVRLLKGAEQVGRLEEGFQDAGDYILTGYTTRQRILGAMYYPFAAMALLIGATFFLVYKVFPVLAKMYLAFQVKLPWETEALIHITNTALAIGPFVLVGCAAIALGIFLTLRDKRTRLYWDRLFLRIPVVGQILTLGSITRTLRTLQSGLRAALPLEETILLSAEAAGNAHFTRQIEEAMPEIVSGSGIAGPLKDTKIFPPLVTQGLEIGEDTGTLETTLEHLVAYYSKELDAKVKGVAEALNPILTGIAAVGVGFLLISTLLPMYSILGQIKGV